MGTVLQSLALLFGIMGIVFTINATYKLFKQITGLRPIEGLSSDKQRELGKDDLYRDLLKKINDEIRHANKMYEDDHKHDKKKWMKQIILGAIFSAISLIFSFLEFVLTV